MLNPCRFSCKPSHSPKHCRFIHNSRRCMSNNILSRYMSCRNCSSLTDISSRAWPQRLQKVRALRLSNSLNLSWPPPTHSALPVLQCSNCRCCREQSKAKPTCHSCLSITSRSSSSRSCCRMLQQCRVRLVLKSFWFWSVSWQRMPALLVDLCGLLLLPASYCVVYVVWMNEAFICVVYVLIAKLYHHCKCILYMFV